MDDKLQYTRSSLVFGRGLPHALVYPWEKSCTFLILVYCLILAVAVDPKVSIYSRSPLVPLGTHLVPRTIAGRKPCLASSQILRSAIVPLDQLQQEVQQYVEVCIFQLPVKVQDLATSIITRMHVSKYVRTNIHHDVCACSVRRKQHETLDCPSL